MLCLRKPSDALLQKVLEDQKARPFPYPEVGVTAGGSGASAFPTGFRHDRFEADLGTDAGDRFLRAGQALRDWTPQRGAGIRVFPGTPVAVGLAFVLALPLPVAGWAIAPGRVVYVIEESDRFGYAYGTLPGHPERGEEALFVIRTQGRVRFEVIAFSRPHDPLVRLGGPVARALQVRTIETYLRSVEVATR